MTGVNVRSLPKLVNSDLPMQPRLESRPLAGVKVRYIRNPFARRNRQYDLSPVLKIKPESVPLSPK